MSAPTPPGPVNPWQRIWTAPASTISNLLQFGQGDAWALPLLFGTGLLLFLAPQAREAMTQTQLLPPGTAVLNVALILGIVVGAMQALLWPLALWGVARLLGGQGTLRGARLAAAWSSLPVLLSYVLAPLGADSTSALGALYGTLSFFLTGWTLYLLVQSLAAAQRFSSGRAVGSVLIGGLLFVLALFFACIVAAVVLVLLGVRPPQLPSVR
jgi:Yip1 domain